MKMGGFTTGGLNFDAKRRRESWEPVDLVHAHVVGMDAFARGLKTAAAIRADGRIGGVHQTTLRHLGQRHRRRRRSRQDQPRRARKIRPRQPRADGRQRPPGNDRRTPQRVHLNGRRLVSQAPTRSGDALVPQGIPRLPCLFFPQTIHPLASLKRKNMTQASQAFLREPDKKPRAPTARLRSELNPAVYKDAAVDLIFLRYLSDFIGRCGAWIAKQLRDPQSVFIPSPADQGTSTNVGMPSRRAMNPG